MHFSGVFPILATPFDHDEGLDLDSFRRSIEFMIEIGVDGITVLGILGEANRLVDRERNALITAAVETSSGRIPVIAGSTHPGTRATVELSREAAACGASAVMITPSREPTPSDDQIVEYVSLVAEATALPLILQDHPASTQVHMPVPLISRIIESVPNVVSLKEEAPPVPPRISALLPTLRKNQVTLLTALGGLYGAFELERGSDGFMTGFAFPEVLLAMTKAAREGDMNRVYAIYTRFLPLIVFEQQPGLAIRKEIYRLRACFRGNHVRHPGATIDPPAAQQLAGVLERVLPGVDITRPIQV